MQNQIFFNRFFKILFLLIVFQNCTKNSKESIVLKIKLDQAHRVPLSVVANKLDYLKLGNPSKGDLSFYPITKLFFSNDRIYVFSREVGRFQPKLISFDKQGKFLNFLGGQIDGPYSFTGIVDANFQNEQIELIDYLKRKIFTYDSKLTLSDTMNLPDMFGYFVRLGENVILETDNSPTSMSKKTFGFMLFQPKTGKSKLYLDLIENFRIGSSDIRFSFDPEKDLLYWRSCDPNIYEIDKNTGKLHIKYTLDYGKLWLNPKNFKEDTDILHAFNENEGVYNFSSVIETQNELYVFNNFKRKLYLIKYQKKSQKTEVFRLEENDLDGGIVPRTPPIAFIPPFTFVFSLNPEEVYTFKKQSSSGQNQTFFRFAQNFKINDNPPLMFLDIK